MQCKQCGHENTRPIMQPVSPSSPSAFLEGEIEIGRTLPLNIDLYVRWACEKCNRYHFRDGTLYENPFRAPTLEETKARILARE